MNKSTVPDGPARAYPDLRTGVERRVTERRRSERREGDRRQPLERRAQGAREPAPGR